MSEHLEKEIEELKELIKNQPDPIENSGKVIKWAQSIIALVIVVAGLGVNWGITTSKVSSLEARLDESRAQQTLAKDEVKKLQEEVIELRLKDAMKDQTLTFIKSELSEIKVDIKKLVER